MAPHRWCATNMKIVSGPQKQHTICHSSRRHNMAGHMTALQHQGLRKTKWVALQCGPAVWRSQMLAGVGSESYPALTSHTAHYTQTHLGSSLSGLTITYLPMSTVKSSDLSWWWWLHVTVFQTTSCSLHISEGVCGHFSTKVSMPLSWHLCRKCLGYNAGHSRTEWHYMSVVDLSLVSPAADDVPQVTVLSSGITVFSWSGTT